MRLKAAGHRGVVGYGWSAFIAALEAEARARDARLKDMALAARMALGVALQHGFQVDQADVVIEKRLGNL